MHRSLVLLLALPLVMGSIVSTTIGRAVEVAMEMFALFAPHTMRLATGAPDMALSIDGTAIDTATQHSLRHEAGVPRFASARNT